MLRRRQWRLHVAIGRHSPVTEKPHPQPHAGVIEDFPATSGVNDESVAAGQAAVLVENLMATGRYIPEEDAVSSRDRSEGCMRAKIRAEKFVLLRSADTRALNVQITSPEMPAHCAAESPGGLCTSTCPGSPVAIAAYALAEDVILLQK